MRLALKIDADTYRGTHEGVPALLGLLDKHKVRATFQLNVKNVQENGGGLQATQAFPDGTPLAYRIVDPRQFILSASFDL